MKTENPRMNFVLKLFKLQNWRKLRPAEPANTFKARVYHVLVILGIYKRL